MIWRFYFSFYIYKGFFDGKPAFLGYFFEVPLILSIITNALPASPNSNFSTQLSFPPNKNIADDYINAVQNNATRLDTLNQTIKKYNQALLYCKQESRDLAIIQLKKVLSLNPKLVKGHQLLALLYMQEGHLEKAKHSLRNAGKIDTDKGNLCGREGAYFDF